MIFFNKYMFSEKHLIEQFLFGIIYKDYSKFKWNRAKIALLKMRIILITIIQSVQIQILTIGNGIILFLHAQSGIKTKLNISNRLVG